MRFKGLQFDHSAQAMAYADEDRKNRVAIQHGDFFLVARPSDVSRAQSLGFRCAFLCRAWRSDGRRVEVTVPGGG